MQQKQRFFKAKSPFYAAGGQSLNTARPNMDNVDNRTQTRPPLCVRIRPVVCVVSTTGQKPETDERRAFSLGRVLAVFVKCRNTTDKTDICPPFRLYFGYISAIFSRFLAVFGQRPPRRVEAIPYTPPNMDNVDNMDNTRKKRPDVWRLCRVLKRAAAPKDERPKGTPPRRRLQSTTTAAVLIGKKTAKRGHEKRAQSLNTYEAARYGHR